MDTKDLHWLAGLLEGEGCFDLNMGRYPRIQLVMADEDVVRKARSLIGSGSLCRHKTKKRETHSVMWHYAVSGKNAATLMEQLLPLLGLRRAMKINEILNIYRS